MVGEKAGIRIGGGIGVGVRAVGRSDSTRTPGRADGNCDDGGSRLGTNVLVRVESGAGEWNNALGSAMVDCESVLAVVDGGHGGSDLGDGDDGKTQTKATYSF